MSLHPPPALATAASGAAEAEESVFEEDDKEDCDHLSAALVTGQLAALRMLHIPFR